MISKLIFVGGAVFMAAVAAFVIWHHAQFLTDAARGALFLGLPAAGLLICLLALRLPGSLRAATPAWKSLWSLAATSSHDPGAASSASAAGASAAWAGMPTVQGASAMMRMWSVWRWPLDGAAMSESTMSAWPPPNNLRNSV